jgi:3-hydroxyacyl-[acyl-carrier-protein] dehydratase
MRPVAAGRPPFATPLLAVDDITVTRTDGSRLCATKRIDTNDVHMRAHFPSLTIFPGVFIVESVRQAVALALPAFGAGAVDVSAVRSARFLAPLLAGDTMTLDVTVRARAETLEVRAECTRGDGVTAARLRLELEPIALDA